MPSTNIMWHYPCFVGCFPCSSGLYIGKRLHSFDKSLCNEEIVIFLSNRRPGKALDIIFMHKFFLVKFSFPLEARQGTGCSYAV